jgi:hypothetical protein
VSEINDVDDLEGMLPDEILAVVRRERARAQRAEQALAEVRGHAARLETIAYRAETVWKSLFRKEESIKLPGQVLVHCLNLGHAIVEHAEILAARESADRGRVAMGGSHDL